MNFKLFIGLALLGWLGAVHAESLTQKELFELRTQCGQLAKAREDEYAKKDKDYGWVYRSSSQYDVSTNRCYVETWQRQDTRNSYLVIFALLDGQTEKLLATANQRADIELGEMSLNGGVYEPDYKPSLPGLESGTGAPHERSLVEERGRANYNDAMRYINEKMGANKLE